MRVQKSIERKLLLRLILFTAVLAAAFCLLASAVTYGSIVRRYGYAASSLTASLAEMIDGGRAAGYLASGEPDDHYLDIRGRILVLAEKFRTEALYVVVPDGDGIVYLWSDDTETPTDVLGFRESVPPEEQAWLAARLGGEGENDLRYFNDPVYGRLVSAAAPILDGSGKPVALAMADFSAGEIDAAILRIVLLTLLVTAVLSLIYILLFYAYIRRGLTRPILRLTQAAAGMADHLDSETIYRSDIHTGDELETLSLSFEKMEEDLRRYLSENLRITADRERIGAELRLASAIQADQLPRVFPPFPDRRDLDIYASMAPAKTVGGDFYDFFLLDDSRLALVIADVSGKGIPASLFMMVSRLLIRNSLQAGEGPARTLAAVNSRLMENNESGQFVTVWLAVLDLAAGRGVAANAGHEHPALRRAGGPYELAVYRHAPPVAILDPVVFREHDFELSPGDALFVYTDGVTEATDSDNQLFGTDRLLEALNRDPGADAAGTLKNVAESIRAFVGPAEQFDDITMLCFRYLGQEGGSK